MFPVSSPPRDTATCRQTCTSILGFTTPGATKKQSIQALLHISLVLPTFVGIICGSLLHVCGILWCKKTYTDVCM